jgi:hypothetical protein
MAETHENLFEKLKRPKKQLKNKKPVSSIFFQLNFDDIGAYLKVINENQIEIKPDYLYYSGHTRNLLKTIVKINERN